MPVFSTAILLLKTLAQPPETVKRRRMCERARRSSSWAVRGMFERRLSSRSKLNDVRD